MKQNLFFGILAFIAGILIAYFSESFLRSLIQDIFIWSTTDKIKFVGKDFYVFSNKLYYITFGLYLLILVLDNIKQEPLQLLKRGILSLLIFGISLVIISSIDANLKLVECTACDDGTRKLHWNEINYGLIIGTSVVVSFVPSLIRLIKHKKKACVQQYIKTMLKLASNRKSVLACSTDCLADNHAHQLAQFLYETLWCIKK